MLHPENHHCQGHTERHVVISDTSEICVCEIQEPNLELSLGNEEQMFEALWSPRQSLKIFLERRIKFSYLYNALDNCSLKLLQHHLVCLLAS